MSHPEFAHIGTAEGKCIEECAELIHAVSKAERFGWFNKYDGMTNIEWVKLEMDDVVEAIERLQEKMRQMKDQR
jgi:hypothetical protein